MPGPDSSVRSGGNRKPVGNTSATTRQALARFLSGYSGLPREAYTLDMRQ